jgi:hypothetical protein
MPSRGLAWALVATAALAQPTTLVDRVVAVVDEDPILLSEVERAVGLGLHGARAGESAEAARRRALDGLIEQRIRLHEISRFGAEPAPLEQVERQLAALRARFPDEAAWRAELARLAMTEAEVRHLLARQLSILTYVEERLGPRVFVGLDEIRRHFDEVLVPELRRRGDPVPPIEDVREQIRAVLREQALDREIALWTDELRRAADVVDLLDVEERELPPVRFELPVGGAAGD